MATGQTGIMIEGWGVAVDRVISDFVAGTVEWLVEQAEAHGRLDLRGGPGFASTTRPTRRVTLGLIHGAAPHAMVLVHEPGRALHHGWEDRPGRPRSLKPLDVNDPRSTRRSPTLVAPVAVLAIALNTGHLPEPTRAPRSRAWRPRRACATDDPVRFGAERLLDALRAGLADLP